MALDVLLQPAPGRLMWLVLRLGEPLIGRFE